MSPAEMLLLLVPITVAFTVSAAVGLGGSLVLVPALTLALGAKEGVALAALLLALNNVLKVYAYRDSLPVRRAAIVVLLTIVGAAIGASLLVSASERVVTIAVVVALAASFLVEGAGALRVRRAGAPVLAFGSGATSGFSGTSGPLKGVAVKALDLDRLHTVGAASLVSLAGDATKTAIFTDAGLLGSDAWTVAALAAPLMVLGTWGGRTLASRLDERRWSALFWATMAGYTARLLVG